MIFQMDPEKKAEWVRRLRSGEYPQAKGRLRTPEGFCCHGVRADQALEAIGARWEAIPAAPESELLEFRFVSPAPEGTESSISMPPGSVNEYFAMDSMIVDHCWFDAVPYYQHTPYGDELKSIGLAYLNDQGFTFDQIADVIEWGM